MRGNQCGQAEVEAGRLTTGMRDRLRDGLESSQDRWARGIATRELENRRSPRITPWVERMSEAGDGLSAPERVGDELDGITG